MAKDNPWITHGSEVRYDNPWIRVTEHQVTRPDGSPGIYGTVHFKSLAIGIVPLDEADHTWLVGQYRYPIGEYSWEIPAGGGAPEGEPLQDARRELKEETGIIAHSWELILQTHLSNSVTDEKSLSYLARDLEFAEAEPEPTEQLQLRRVPLAEALAMIQRGEITDALSVLSLLKVARDLGL